jgi:hypothetical protein
MMHPLLTEQMAQMHRQELLSEAGVARSVDEAYNNAEGKTYARRLHRERWSLIFGLPALYSTANQAWLGRRMRATIRVVGLGAFGAGSLVGSFLGSRFGLLPAAVFSCIICLVITLSVLVRLFIAIKGHLHGIV